MYDARQLQTNDTPWFGLGHKLKGATSVQEAIVQAGANWRVDLSSLYLRDQEDNSKIGERVSHKATVRVNEDGTTDVLGIVGPRYRVLQNEEAFQFFNDFVSGGFATLETAGILSGGKRVWILAKLTGGEISIVPKANDTIEKYLLLSNSHDGSSPVRLGFTPIRVYCQNTLAAAHSDSMSRLLRIRHTGQVQDNLSMIQNAINIVNGRFETTVEQYRQLARRGIKQADLDKYIDILFTQEEDGEQKESPNQKRIDKISELFETGQGNDRPGVRGTMWAAYNSVTEYLSWVNGRNQDSRLNSLWFGEAAKLNDQALSVAVSMVA